MGDQDQRVVASGHRIAVVFAWLAAPVLRAGQDRIAHTLHRTQHALDDLLEIGLAFAQIGIFHFIKTA